MELALEMFRAQKAMLQAQEASSPAEGDAGADVDDLDDD